MSTEFPSTFCPPRFHHLEFFHIQAIFQGMILDSGQALVIVYPHDRFYLFLLKLQPIRFYRPCVYIDSADFMVVNYPCLKTRACNSTTRSTACDSCLLPQTLATIG